MAVLSALLDAVTVMVGGEGIALGAVYKPLGEIVPTVALPPATPPANHVTLLFDVPVTVAWNCCDWLRETLICVGCKTTVTTERARRRDSRATGHRDGSDAKERKQEQIRRTIRSVKRGGSPTQSRFQPPPFD